jgi:hypothetical protein
VPVAAVDANSNCVYVTCPIVATVCNVRVLIADMGASNNDTCAMCPTLTMGEERPLLLGHYSSDGTVVMSYLPIATDNYRSLLQRRTVVVI